MYIYIYNIYIYIYFFSLSIFIYIYIYIYAHTFNLMKTFGYPTSIGRWGFQDQGGCTPLPCLAGRCVSWAPLLLHQYCYTGASCKIVFFRDAWRHRIKHEVLSRLSVLKLQGRCPTKAQKVHTLTGFSHFVGHCKSLADQG